MTKPTFTWQGIGISSNPFQKEEPLSLNLQTYLRESAQSGERHLILIADEMQIPNYMTLHNINESKARKIALKKGKKKQKAIQRILKANGLENVDVIRFNDLLNGNQKIVLNQLTELYNSNPQVRDMILSCVPDRLKEKANNSNLISNYALTEIGLILSVPGIKFGHEKEKSYDSVALQLNEIFGIGHKPQFQYSKTPLEFIADKGFKVEPYSTIQSPRRLLLTDSLLSLQNKLDGLSDKLVGKVKNELKNAGLKENDSLASFFQRTIAPVQYALDAPRRMLKRTLLATGIGLTSIVLAGTYIQHDAKNIKQKHMNNLSVFALNGDIKTSERAINEELAKANKEIKQKYHLDNYFKTFSS